MAELFTHTCLFENGEVTSGSGFAWEHARDSFCVSSTESSAGSTDAWEWRCANAPDGACVAVVTDGERVVSRILGTRKQAVLDGQQVTFVEVFDLYNDFEYRHGLGRANSLKQCGEAFSKSFGGRAPESFPILYGVPTRRAHRFGLRHLRWEILRSEARLRLRPQGHCAPAAPGVEVEEITRFPDQLDPVCAEVSASRGAMLVRDARRLNHRFCERPDSNYTIAAARKNGQFAGYCVLADGALVDWVCPHESLDVASAMVVWGDERARTEGHEGLAASFPETAPEWLIFQRFGFWIQGGMDYTVFRSFHKPYIMSWLFFNWYYTPADLGRV